MTENKLMKVFVVLVLLALALVQLLVLVSADPLPPETFTVVTTSRKPATGVASAPALAGNVSELTISIDQVTKNWQGYYGEVTGSIVLDDVRNQSLYEWDLLNPLGEVYATRNSTTLNWTGGNIKCANLTHIMREELDMNTNAEMTGGAQARDGVNETFNWTTHPAFNVSNNGFDASACNYSTSLFVNDTNPSTGNVPRDFNETLLWSESDSALIFMAYISPNQYGFNESTWDFQMLVTEDGHLDNQLTTDYYFYVELE